jgi:TonB-dependent starch-binding outer membrane protein SusC
MLFSLLLLTGSLVMAQTVMISGTVTSSEDGLPIPGVSVFVKGTTLGMITGADGKYVLAVPTNAQSLVYSFIGFKTQEALIAGKTKIDVVLEQDLFKVDEVVVVAYGTQQKRDVAGAITTVKGDAIRSIPVQSFDQALQGKAAGVSITVPNGVLGNPPVIRIRGFNSISSSSYPLVVVDGVAMFTGDVSSSNAASNALADINPSDIASMDILKDASATALYGSRAANGVILITTKHGTGGKTQVTYDGNVGYTEPYHLFDMMNATEYIEHKNMAQQNAVANPATAPQFTPILDVNGNLVDTDWTDYIYQRGFQQNHAITFSGSTPSTNYFLSVGLTDQDGMIQKNTYKRKNARLNLDHKLNKYISLGTTISYVNSYSEAPNTGSLSGQAFSTAGAGRLAFVLPPMLPAYLNDGSYNISGATIGTLGQPFGNVGYYNPAAIFDLCNYSAESDRIMATLNASIEFVKGLVFKTVYGIDNLNVESITFQTPITGDGYSINGYAGNTFNRQNRWTWTNTLSYNLQLSDKYNISLLVGEEEQYTERNSWDAGKRSVSDPFFKTYQGAWVTADNNTGTQYENYFISYFGRVNFNYNRKYFLEVSARRDGFSGLSADNKYGNFGGASIMWNVSNENFIANGSLGDIFSDIRLKASYGKVGNQSGIGNYSSLFLYGSGLYGAAPNLQFTQAGNSDLRWEASNKYDVGLSFGILKDKVQLDLNYFYNDVNDLILDVPQSPSKGIPNNTIPANMGKMYNTGVELTATSYNISTPQFTWTTTFNFSTLKNRVTELAPGVTEINGVTNLETANKTLVGYPIGNLYTVVTNGVDPATGRRIFLNNDGREILFRFEAPSASRWIYKDDGTNAPAPTVATDGKVVGSPLPKYYGGLDNNFTYKDFDLSFSLTYAFGFQVYNGSKAGLRDQRFWNNSAEVYNTAWENPGDVTNIPKPIWGDNISNGSSFPISENVEDAGYVKIRNISLGYTFKKLPDIMNIQRIRVYAQTFNTYVFTNYTGSDPEVSANGNSNLAPGIDRNSAPQARSFAFGLNVTF